MRCGNDYAIESHRRAARAADAGKFKNEIVPIDLAVSCADCLAPTGIKISVDETTRRDTSREKLASLNTSFRPQAGRVTAGNASQNCRRRAVERAGLKLANIDLFEVNQAFAPVPLIWMRELDIGHDILNVNGGAIALGHPVIPLVRPVLAS